MLNSDTHVRRTLEQRVGADAGDAEARYQLAVLLLDEHVAAPAPDLLEGARIQLARAIEVRPAHAPSHAALGYVYDLAEGGGEPALACFREARRLDPKSRHYDIYVLTLLEATGREEEALAEMEGAARRHSVDLEALRRSLAAARMPADTMTLLLNGFIHARNFFRSFLADEADDIRNGLEHGRARRVAAAERTRCLEDQQRLQESFDPSRVPEAIRALGTWASRYGIGDDYCRPLLIKRLSIKQRAKLLREVDEHADAIRAWLDSFGQSQMPPEAAAVMYLTIGVDEIRESRDKCGGRTSHDC